MVLDPERKAGATLIFNPNLFIMDREQVLAAASFDVAIRSASVNVMRKGITYEQAKKVVAETQAQTQDDPKLQEMIRTATSLFGFGGQSHGDYRADISAYMPRTGSGLRMRCPQRGPARLGDVNETEFPDEWDLINGDQVCSYCGSASPETVYALIKEHGPGLIERSTKTYKWYLHRPWIPNAAFGAIKYYRWHDIPDFADYYDTAVAAHELAQQQPDLTTPPKE
jgi:hypothetical protein